MNNQAQGWVDAHTHAYGEEVFSNGADPVLWASERGETHWAKLVAPNKNGVSLQGFVTRAQMLEDMQEANVSHALLVGWYWQHAETCRWHNRVMAQWIAGNPAHFSAFAAVQPRDNPDLLKDLQWAHDHGFKGVGELFPAVQGYDMRDARFFELLEFAQAHNWPVNLHVEEPVGRPHAGRRAASLQDYVFIAERFEKVRFIFSHWGGGLPFYELNPHVRSALKNVFYDCAASPFLYDDSVFKKVIEIVGAHRVLFGSDYPLRLYPKKNSPPKIASFTRAAAAQLTSEQATLVMGENARGLLGI